MIGQSQVRNAGELRQYREMLTRYPVMIDLVDKTTLTELVALMDRFAVLISCDLSPIHLALARQVPVVGLFVNDATFRLHSEVDNTLFVALNSTPPVLPGPVALEVLLVRRAGIRRRGRRDRHNDVFVFGVDRIPLDRIDQAVRRLSRETHGRAHS